MARSLAMLLLSALLTLQIAAQKVIRRGPEQDWPQFGSDVASTSAPSGATGIHSGNLGALARRQVAINGVVDASAIYLHDVAVHGADHDVFFVTTSYGKTIAVD